MIAEIKKEMDKVKNTYYEMLENKGNYTFTEVMEMANELAEQIVKTDSRLISIGKKSVGYGYWESVGFANKYHFGEELARMIEKTLTGFTTNEEEHEFKVSDFEEFISEAIVSKIY